jgi:hypothetical protein
MSFATAKDLILFLLAIYAAALSTWNLVQALRKDRRNVRVTAGTKMPVMSNGELGRTWAHLEATNVGQRPVTISLLTFEIAPGKRIFGTGHDGRPDGMEDTQLPASLTDGQTARRHFAYADVGSALLSEGQRGPCKITPICEDTAGGIYRGEARDVDLSELVGM